MNTIDIYTLNIKNINELDKYLYYLSDTRSKMIKEISNHERIKEHIMTDTLVHYALNKYKKIEKLILTYDRFGKPMYDDEFNISVSHTKNFLAIAISKSNIGIDVQWMNDKNLKLAKEILSKEEFIQYEKSLDKLKSFHVYWTAKESFCKLLGNVGIEVMKEMTIVNSSIKFKEHLAAIKNYTIDDYSLAVAYQKRKPITIFNVNITEMNINH